MNIRCRSVMVLLAALLALVIAGCGDDDDSDSGDAGATTEEGARGVSGKLAISGVWTGQEAKSFEAVLDGFKAENPDVEVSYDAAGDELPTVLSTAVKGGNPPDLAAIPQPGVVRDFFEQGELEPLDFAKDPIESNFTEGVIDVSTFDGKIYGLLFKAANKSTIWYNVPLFETAGVEPPETFDELVKAADTLRSSGTKPYSFGADAGWPITDLFENIYLRQAGPEQYDRLAQHEIPWTDQSVKDALQTMTEVIGNADNLVGGRSGAVQTDFPTSVSNAFKEDPKGAMVIEGDFVGSEISASTPAEPVTGYDVFDFPSVDGSEPAVVGGGDTIVMFEDSPAAQALVEYLATPEAAEVWAARGGFSSANQALDASVYKDELTRKTSSALAEAETFRFDMSDLAPAAFGATVGKGEWQILTDFLSDPDDVDGTAKRLEQAAKKAF